MTLRMTFLTPDCVIYLLLLGVKRARVSSGGLSDSPGGFSKHIRSDMDFSPMKSAHRSECYMLVFFVVFSV